MNRIRLLVSSIGFVFSLLICTGARAEATDWTLDTAHSRVGFSVSHLVVSTVSGHFKQLSGTVKLDQANLTKSQVEVNIKADSIDTSEPKRDEHLRSPDFFDVAKYPSIAFSSTKIVRAGGNKYKLTGDLTMHGATKSVTLDATISDAIKNPWGKQVRAVKLSGKLKRSDFGLKWNKALDSGGVVVGDEVTLDIQVEVNQ
jgi:polyisoprenoid-binding protein YceI